MLRNREKSHRIGAGLLLRVVATVLAACSGALLHGTQAQQRYSSDSYAIDAGVIGNAAGGSGGSSSYKMVSSVGEPIAGDGSAGSYKLGQGFVAQVQPDQPAIQLSVQPGGLNLGYGFDEGGGTASNDVSIAHNTGANAGSPAYVSGQIGTALQLNGSSQYVSATQLVTGPQTFTASVWFKTTTTAGGALIGFRSAQSSPLSYDRTVYMSNDGRLHFGVNTGTVQTLSSPASYNDGVWHRVTVTLSDTGQALYVNGARVALNQSVTSAQVYDGYWRIGENPVDGWPSAPASQFFAGAVDEVKIFNRGFTAEEVGAEYRAQNAGNRSGLSLNRLIPGVSQTSTYDALIQASTGSYSLAISQGTDLSSGGNIIPGIVGSIASPQAWFESTTKGLGFTVVSAPQADPAWNGGASYAALPATGTTFYSRSGYTPNNREKISMRLRADVPPDQPAGLYRSTMTVTGTAIP